jgi:hypothetical protein
VARMPGALLQRRYGQYRSIRERLGPFDLVMLEVGAFHPAWGDIHLGAENALEALALPGGGSFLPVHWGTFSLAMHAWDQPAETLLKLAPKAGARLPYRSPCPGRSTRPANALSNRRSPGGVSIEMPNARHATCHLYNRRQNNPHLLLRHDEETDMTGYRILILIAAILITGCEALIFVGTTAVN